jgi:hypothetical protein
MRRSIAIVLAMLFSWMLMLPVLVPSSTEVSLPACCRKAGKHHCAMHAALPQGSTPALATMSEKCPYFPHGITAAHNEIAVSRNGASFFAGLWQHPALWAQTEAGYRISAGRSRQKRGPPSFLIA